MIPAIGPESGVFCVLAVFALAAGGHGRPRQSHREATGGHGKATGSGGQSQIPYVFPFGRPREATAKPREATAVTTDRAVTGTSHSPYLDSKNPNRHSRFRELSFFFFFFFFIYSKILLVLVLVLVVVLVLVLVLVVVVVVVVVLSHTNT